MPDPGNERWLTHMLMLLPGFLALGLANYITRLETYSDFELAAYSLSLSLVIFAVASLVYKLILSLTKRVTKNTQQDNSIIPPPSTFFIMITILVTLLAGIAIAQIYESDTVLRVLRKSPVTRMTTKRSSARPLVFLFSQNRIGQLEEGRPGSLKVQEAWVRITLEGGKTISGYPEFFPIGDEDSEIFLSPACNGGGRPEAHPGPGILVREDRIVTVEFLDRDSSECYEIWRNINSSTTVLAP